MTSTTSALAIEAYEAWARVATQQVSEILANGAGAPHTTDTLQVHTERQKSGLFDLKFWAQQNGQNTWHAPLAANELNTLLNGSILSYTVSDDWLTVTYDPRPPAEAAADYPYLQWLVAGEAAIKEHQASGEAPKVILLDLQLNGHHSKVSLRPHSEGIEARFHTTDDTRWLPVEATRVFERYATLQHRIIGVQNSEFLVIFTS